MVDCALEIHKELGPGLLETVYEVLLADSLTQSGFSVERQKPNSYSPVSFLKNNDYAHINYRLSGVDIRARARVFPAGTRPGLTDIAVVGLGYVGFRYPFNLHVRV